MAIESVVIALAANKPFGVVVRALNANEKVTSPNPDLNEE